MEQCKVERSLHLARRQQCACLIQEIGSRLQTTQVVINAGIYYMHYFYEVFSPETIKPILVAIAAFYCACKTEEFSRKLSFLIKAAYDIIKRPAPDEASDAFKRLVQNVHALEATILMVIGFHTLEVKQPHVFLIKAIRANKFPKEIAHTSYYVCTNILHLTTLVLRHSAEAIAAASLYIAAKWNGTDIQSSNGEWYHIFSPTLTFEEVAKITDEFTLTFQECDLKIREQLRCSLKSRKLQRERRDEPTNNPPRTQEPQRRSIPDSQQKTDSWKGEKRPFSSTNSNAPQIMSQHPNHARSHTSGSQNPQTNHPYHGHNRGPTSHVYGNEHFNRSHSNRPPGPGNNEPDPKRQRFDRQFPNQYRRSPQPHMLSGHHPDGAGRTNRIENSVSHSGGGEHKAHYPPAANRVHGTEYRMAPSAGYNSVSNKVSSVVKFHFPVF
ncbi:Cyclin-T2 isoform 3 [Schistosoma japonicum]|uniref:Cyclin-T2 isoform 3 n=1 Tax=Schistosoma japonicum TaxID=6182 RepID=A0A4Z2DV13_SCHJA|nr:Cyclin-T2 isoform 3 [Schistosoma japonicum]